MPRRVEQVVRAQTVAASAGAVLRVVEAGSGPAVMLVPGWTMDWTVFERQIPMLAGRWRVIAIDPRGQGQSTTRLESCSYDQQGRDIGTVADALGVDDFHLLGWSYGGLAAYAYVAAAGVERLRSLVIVDMTPKPFACTGEADQWREGDWSFYHDDYLVPLRTDRAAFASTFVDWMVSRPLAPRDRAWLTEMHNQTPLAVALAYQYDAIFADFSAIAAQTSRTRPLLNVVRDDWIGQARPWLERHAASARLERMASHLGFWEAADAFNALIEQFLDAADR